MGIVDRRLGPQGAALLMILLDPRTLVVDVQRRCYPLGDHAGAEPPRRLLGDPPLEDQLHVIGPADVEVLADHLLEEHAAGVGSVEDLGQGELSLKDRNVVAIAGLSILWREGVRDARQPLSEQCVDLVGRESIAELLQTSGVGAAQNAVVQGLEGYPFLGQLSLDILVAVDAELGVVGEVGPYGVRIDNLLSISRSFVGGGSVPRSESPDGAGSYRTAPQGPLFRAQSRKSVGPYGVRIDNLLSISRSFVGGGSVLRSESPDGAGSYRTAPQGPLFRAQARKSVGPYGVRIDNLLSISRSFVGGGSVLRSESPDGAGSYRTAPQ